LNAQQQHDEREKQKQHKQNIAIGSYVLFQDFTWRGVLCVHVLYPKLKLSTR
jgi:hypothetical protein